MPGENEIVRQAVGRHAITGRGVRILSMDGGGMKVVVLTSQLGLGTAPREDPHGLRLALSRTECNSPTQFGGLLFVLLWMISMHYAMLFQRPASKLSCVSGARCRNFQLHSNSPWRHAWRLEALDGFVAGHCHCEAATAARRADRQANSRAL